MVKYGLMKSFRGARLYPRRILFNCERMEFFNGVGRKHVCKSGNTEVSVARSAILEGGSFMKEKTQMLKTKISRSSGHWGGCESVAYYYFKSGNNDKPLC